MTQDVDTSAEAVERLSAAIEPRVIAEITRHEDSAAAIRAAAEVKP